MLMAEGRSRAEWGRAASLMALLANCHRNPKKRHKPFHPDEFMPRAKRRGSRVSVEQLTRDVLRASRSRGITSRPASDPANPPFP